MDVQAASPSRYTSVLIGEKRTAKRMGADFTLPPDTADSADRTAPQPPQTDRSPVEAYERMTGRTLPPPPAYQETRATQARGEGTPPSVQDILDQTQRETGYNPYGIGADGMATHITTTMTMRLEQQYKTGSSDLFGDSMGSALAMAQKILDRINNPLVPPKSDRERQRLADERAFYDKLIENLQ